MRCKNCGWPNKPNERNCVKCHTPLEAENDDVFLNNVSHHTAGNAPLNKTVMEERVFGPAHAPHQSKPQDEDTKPCPKCGYPVRPGTDKCPNCKFSVAQSEPEAPRQPRERFQDDGQSESVRRPTRMTGEEKKEENRKSVFKGTINPYMMNLETEPIFSLKPIKRINERHELEELEYKGEEVILNRDNTEQDNASITSRQQAVITKSGNRWYIEDRSEQKTTFVQASTKIELHEGDILLLGNRLFEFHE